MAQRDELMSEMLGDEELDIDENAVEDESLESDSVEEVDADSIVSELASVDGDLSIDDLRKLPGADQYTDEQLEQMWQQALNPPKTPRSYKFFKDDTELEALEGLSAEELLELKVSYQAMGKEQRKSFDEIVRNAQLGHFNEARMNQIMQQRDEIHRKYQEIQPQYEKQSEERKLLEYALSQYNMGNGAPLEALINAFRAEAGKVPEFRGAQNETSDYELEAAGQKVYYETVLPAAQDLASRYGANAQEIEKAILFYVDHEPDEFMSPQRLQEIIERDVPVLLEQNGYMAGIKQKPVDEIAELRKQVAELKAAQKNGTVKAAKNKKVPSAGGGATPSVGDSMPTIKNRQDMKDYLRA